MDRSAPASNEIHFLLLEDNDVDAELISSLLTNAQAGCNFMRVETESAFRSTLAVQPVDIILADYALPTFDGLNAIRIANEVCPGVPCILLSGVIGEERAIEALQTGAVDYVLKHRLERLVPAVQRALKQRQERLALQQAEREREESEQRFQTLMETISDPLAVIEIKIEQGVVQDYIIRHLNKPACDYLSISIEEAREKSVSSVVPAFQQARTIGDDSHLFDLLLDVLETGLACSEEIVLEGSPSLAQRTVFDTRVVKLNGEIVVLTWRDVTEQDQIAKQRQQLLTELEAARNLAEQANRFKDDFLATVSHGLRSPLSIIKVWATIIEEQPEAMGTISQAIKVIMKNTVLLDSLIEDLLDVSQMSEGNLSFVPEVLSFEQLKQIVVDTINAVEPVATSKQVRLSFQSKSSTSQLSPVMSESAVDGTRNNKYSSQNGSMLRQRIMGDKMRLQQVVRHLLSNAIKFTPEGGQVDVTLSSKNDMISLTVKDTGRGIDAVDLPHLFSRFWQADSTTSKRNQQDIKGLGLGLSISQHIMERHQGHIRAASEGIEQGSTFTIGLPTLSNLLQA